MAVRSDPQMRPCLRGYRLCHSLSHSIAQSADFCKGSCEIFRSRRLIHREQRRPKSSNTNTGTGNSNKSEKTPVCPKAQNELLGTPASLFSYLPSLTRRFTASQKAEASISLRAGRRSRSPAAPVNTNVQVLMVAGLPPLVSVTRTRSSSSPALRISAKGIRIVRSVYPAPVSASISVMETSRAQTSNASRVKNRCERTKGRR